MLSFLLVTQSLLATDVPYLIRIGLESVAKDLQEITIKSEADLKIGYFVGDIWQEEGRLNTSEIRIKPSTSQYYTYQEVYTTYEEARRACAYYEDAVVAYIQPGVYGIYTVYPAIGTDQVATNNKRLTIYDAIGNVILVSENDVMPIGFQGNYNGYGFPVTGVGKERLYRGVIEVVKGQYSGLTAVNVVDFEDYLYGVVNNEMNGSNPMEALKAQAVAARSMATYQYNRFVSRGYNLVDTTTNQVYRGVTSENSNTTRAVDETSGEVAYYNGRVAETIYCSSSGGHTENAKYIWGNDVPYLSGVKDIYEENNHDWTRTITLADIDKCLRDDGINIGNAKGMEIVSFTPSGRVKELRIIGTNGSHTLTKEMPRNFFHAATGGSLKSTMYKFTPYSGNEQWGSSGSTGVDLENTYVLTAAGQEQVSLDGLRVESAYDTAKLYTDEEIAIMSADGLVGGNETTGDTGFNPGNEKLVVYGDVTLYGKGYGHGVGMSQNGAIAMARKGYDYESILNFYYPGVTIR